MSDAVIDNPANRKRYHIHASKSSFVQESFDTIDEVFERMKELAADGYASASYRDSEGEDPWL